MLEFLLLNHPLDCPVCDKGGECPLQDQTFSHGPGESRFVEEKRHYEKPIPISDLVYLDRERCILCDRCTRFAKDVAGDPLIHFMQRGNETQVHDLPRRAVRLVLQRQHGADLPGRRAHRQALPLQGPPVGPRPDREHLHHVLGRVPRHRAVEPQRAAALPGRRQRPGQLGLAVRQGPLRLRGGEQRAAACAAPLVRKAGELVEVGWSEALDRRGRRHLEARSTDGGPSSVAVIGGARGTNEDAYAWAKLAKGVIGTDNVDAQLGDGLDPARARLGLPRATIDEAGARHHGRAARPRPEGRAAGPVPAAARRGREPADEASSSSAPATTGLTPLRLEEPPPPARRAGGRWCGPWSAGGRRPTAPASPMPTSPRSRSSSARAGRRRGRPGLARRVARLHRGRTPPRCARRVPAATFLPVAAPRQRARRPRRWALAPACCPAGSRLDDAGDALQAAWPSVPGRRRARHRRHPRAAAADGRIGCLVLLGADPLSDFPDRDLAQRGPRGRRHDRGRRHRSCQPSSHAGRRRAGRRRLRREGRHHHQPRGSGHARLSQKVTAAGTAHADWIIAADLALRLGHDLGFGSRGARSGTRSRAVSPRHAGITRVGARRRARWRRDRRARQPPSPSSRRTRDAPPLQGYGFRLAVGRKLYDAGVAVALSPSLAGLAPRRPPPPQPVGRRPPRRAGRHRWCRSSRRTPRSILPVDRDAGVPRGVAWVEAQPAGCRP